MNPEMRQQRQDLHLLLKRRHQPQVWRFWHGTQAALFGLRSWIDTRFPEGTEEFTELMKQKKAFQEKYPVQARSTTTSSQAVGVAHPRAGGQCDYSLDGGTAPLGHNERIGFTGSQ